MSHQPLPPVVGSGCKDREVWMCQAQGVESNKGNLPLDASVLSMVSLLSCFPYLVERSPIPLPVVCYHFYPRLCLSEKDSHGQEGIFPWVGPLAQCRHRYRLISLLPPHNSSSKSCCSAPQTDRRVLLTSGLCRDFPSLAFH